MARADPRRSAGSALPSTPPAPTPPRPAAPLAAAGSAQKDPPPPFLLLLLLRGAAVPFLPQPVQPRRWADPPPATASARSDGVDAAPGQPGVGKEVKNAVGWDPGGKILSCLIGS